MSALAGHAADQAPTVCHQGDGRGPLRLLNPCDIDGARRIAALEWVVEFHNLRPRTDKNVAEILEKIRVRRIVRPEAENTPGLHVRRELAEPVRLVERCMARVQQVPRRVVDVQENGVEALPRPFGVEPRTRNRG